MTTNGNWSLMVSLDISISGVAEVDAGSDFTVCAGADVTLNGSVTGAVITGFWWGGSVLFLI